MVLNTLFGGNLSMFTCVYTVKPTGRHYILVDNVIFEE